MTKPQTVRSPHFVRGVICSLLGAWLWGFSGACAQLLLDTYEFPAEYLVCVRMLGAGFIFLIVILVRERPQLIALFKDRSSLLRMAIFGVCGLFLSQITYLVTVNYTNAATATVLQFLGVFFVMVYTCIVVRRLPRSRELIAFVLATGATFILATHGNPAELAMPMMGLIWGIACGLATAIYVVFPKKLLVRWGSLMVTGFGMLFGGIISSIIIRPWTIPVTFDAGSTTVLILFIVVGTFGAFYLFMQGVADVGPIHASLLGAIEPVSAVFFCWVWLGTQFPLIDFVGFAMMIVMVFFVTGRPSKRDTDPDTTGPDQ